MKPTNHTNAEMVNMHDFDYLYCHFYSSYAYYRLIVKNLMSNDINPGNLVPLLATARKCFI